MREPHGRWRASRALFCHLPLSAVAAPAPGVRPAVSGAQPAASPALRPIKLRERTDLPRSGLGWFRQRPRNETGDRQPTKDNAPPYPKPTRRAAELHAGMRVRASRRARWGARVDGSYVPPRRQHPCRAPRALSSVVGLVKMDVSEKLPTASRSFSGSAFDPKSCHSLTASPWVTA
jgi:hypothetical protein